MNCIFLYVSRNGVYDLGVGRRRGLLGKFFVSIFIFLFVVMFSIHCKLTKIDLHLRLALGNDWLFGGKDILLIGDMWQFPPVAPGLANPALYQAIVSVSCGRRAPNEAYRKGAHLFSKFKLVILDGQVRAKPEYDVWLL